MWVIRYRKRDQCKEWSDYTCAVTLASRFRASKSSALCAAVHFALEEWEEYIIFLCVKFRPAVAKGRKSYFNFVVDGANDFRFFGSPASHSLSLLLALVRSLAVLIAHMFRTNASRAEEK